MLTIKHTAEGVFYKIAFSVLIVVIGFFLGQYVLKLNEVQRDIASLHILITKIQGKLLDRNEVRLLIKDYHVTHPCSKCAEILNHGE